MIDSLISQIKAKKNPCIVGIDPEWSKIPECYKSHGLSQTDCIQQWAINIIDTVSDIVPAVKPQMAFFEVYGSKGVEVFQRIVEYAHTKGLIVVDDSKRNDIGNTAKAYAYAHLASDGPIKADFLTVSPFLGTDSLQPFIDIAEQNRKGLFILTKTSNPSSSEISEAQNTNGQKIRAWLASYIDSIGHSSRGIFGYSSIGAVVGATFPKEAAEIRTLMKHCFFLVPGFGSQGGNADDVISCFNDDGLGAVVSSSRGILYAHLNNTDYDHTKSMYLDIVRKQATDMRQAVYDTLRQSCVKMIY